MISFSFNLVLVNFILCIFFFMLDVIGLWFISLCANLMIMFCLFYVCGIFFMLVVLCVVIFVVV